jgi:hypothetical protein
MTIKTRKFFGTVYWSANEKLYYYVRYAGSDTYGIVGSNKGYKTRNITLNKQPGTHEAAQKILDELAIKKGWTKHEPNKKSK